MKYDTGYDRGKLLLEQHHGDCHRILASHKKIFYGVNKGGHLNLQTPNTSTELSINH